MVKIPKSVYYALALIDGVVVIGLSFFLMILNPGFISTYLNYLIVGIFISGVILAVVNQVIYQRFRPKASTLWLIGVLLGLLEIAVFIFWAGSKGTI